MMAEPADTTDAMESTASAETIKPGASTTLGSTTNTETKAEASTSSSKPKSGHAVKSSAGRDCGRRAGGSGRRAGSSAQSAGRAKYARGASSRASSSRGSSSTGSSSRASSPRGGGRKASSFSKTLRQLQTRYRKAWKKANPGKRCLIVLETMVAIICAMALVMGLIRVVQWRTEIAIAQYRQNQTAEKYGFNPGNIISDGQFFNGNAMSQAEIQAFLDKEGASCTGSQCLRVMTFDSENEPAGSECEAYQGAQGETAAAIISKSAKACGVSPKVLLTVLQKEQHLVTATSTTAFQFKAAMGLSCPDDASCDPQYAGFFRQVYGSAKRYKYYLQHEDTYGYHAGSMNYIQYNPNASCGGSQVYIENKSTALLYIYTPYQPNTAALAAGAGEGDSCSAYGNRNFSIIYTGWFGNPRS